MSGSDEVTVKAVMYDSRCFRTYPTTQLGRAPSHAPYGSICICHVCSLISCDSSNAVSPLAFLPQDWRSSSERHDSQEGKTLFSDILGFIVKVLNVPNLKNIFVTISAEHPGQNLKKKKKICRGDDQISSS